MHRTPDRAAADSSSLPSLPSLPSRSSGPRGPRRAGTTRRRRAALGVVAVLAVAAAGCSSDEGEQARPTVMTTVTVPPSDSPAQGGVGRPGQAAPASPPPPAAPAPSARSGAPGGGPDLAALQAAVPAGTGIAFAPVGRPEQVQTAGTWTTGVAWSSIKAPLAVAAARAGQSPQGPMTAAITASDNNAAQSLWDSLGGDQAASQAVTAVLREAGDQSTTVPSTRLRPTFTVFGQTQWPLADQARFGAKLPCLAGAQPVVDLMGQVIPSQRWGLGRIDGARFKGGWGPGEQGGYLVRQFGIVPSAGGDLAVAVATDAASFEAGTATLDQVVAAVGPQLAQAPGGHC